MVIRRRALVKVNTLSGVVLSLLFIASSGYSQQTIYSDSWVQVNGDGSLTVWGTGVTDDTALHGVQHNMWVQTTLSGPNGSPTQELWTDGYASTLVSLAGVEGNYQTSSSHAAACSGGFIGVTYFPPITVGYSISCYQKTGITPEYSIYQVILPCSVYCRGDIIWGPPDQPQQYAEVKEWWWTAGPSRYCTHLPIITWLVFQTCTCRDV
jgi:hypothetical protein